MAPSWLRQLFKKRFAGQGAASPVRRSLRVEVLEDRTVPATVFWTGGAVADVDGNGDGDTTDIGETGSLLWSTGGNWSTGVAPGINDDVVFNNFTPPESANYNAYFADTDNRNAGLTGTVPHSIMDLTTTIKSLTIRGPGPTTGGNSGWFISRGRVVQDPIRDPDFPLGVFVPTTPGRLTILGNVNFDGAGVATTNFDISFVSTLQNINVTTFGARLFINGSIGIGTGVTTPVGILKLGPGTAILGGANTFDGLVQVDTGILAVTDDDALGTSSVGTVVANGATLTVAGAANIPESVQIQGSGMTDTGTPTGTALGALNGNGFVGGGVVLNSSATISGTYIGTGGAIAFSVLDIDGVISGAGNLTTIGTVALNNANTYNGATFVRDDPYIANTGGVIVRNDDALSPGSFTEVASGATLMLSSSGGTGLRLIDDEVLYLNGLGNFNTTLQNFVGALSSTGTLATRTTPAEWRSRIFVATNASIGTVELSNLLVSGQVSNLPIPAATLGTLTSVELDAIQAYNALGRTTTARASLAKLGKGTTIFPNANPDFSGNVVVTNGTIVMRNATALGPATGGSIVVDSDIPTLQFGTLEVQGQYTVQKNLTINGNGYSSVGALLISDNPADGGATAITWSGTVTLTTAASTSNTSATISTDSGQALTVTGIVSGPTGRNLQKNGAGSLTLTAANTFLGSVTVRAGTLAITNSTALGAVGGAGTTISSGATLSLGGGLTIVNEALTLSSELGVAATFLVGSGTNLWTGVVNLVGNSIGTGVDEIIIDTSAGSSIEFSNVISGDSKLRKLGTGTMRFSGTASNTFKPVQASDPSLSIEAGTTVFAKTLGPNGTTVNAIAGPIVIGDGAGGDSVDVLRLEQPNQIPDSVAVSILSSGLLDLNGINETIAGPTLTGGEIRTGVGTLTLAGNVTTLASTDVAKISGKLSLGGVARTFDVANGAADPDLQIDAVISNGPGIIKAGGGTLVLGGANTYTGPTTVTAGVLRLGAHNVLPDTTTVALAGGTTLDMNSFIDSIAAITGGATTTLALGAGALIVGVGNTTSTFGGVITGAAGSLLSKIGTGTLTLTGASPAYTGTTFVGGGTVLVNANQGAARVTVLSGGTLGGTGTVGAITVNAGGQLSPGQSPAVLSANGDVVLSAGSSFIVEAAGTTVGTQYDQLAVTGTATLNNATLVFNPSFTPAVNDSFVILTATGGVTGTFSGLADLATFTTGTRVYQIHYNANDVTVTVLALASTATIQSSTNPSLPGQSVTFTVTITPAVAGDPTPTGTVQFYDNGVSIGTVALSPTGTLNLASASLTTAALTSGSHNITATFTPSSSYQARTQTDLALVQAVTVVSTVSMQALNGPSVFGDTVGFLARVAQQPGLAVPNGTITFINSTTGEVLGVVALDATGGAAINVSTLRVGTSIISAVYSGDAFYRAGSGTATQIVDRQSRMVVGTDAGPQATVQVFDPRTGALLRVLTPFDGYSLGVKVAAGDVNGDGIDDIIVSAGAGAPGGHVKVYNGADYSELASFFTFVGYTGGVNIAAGDVNGDGFDDIIVGTAIANDHVKAFSGRNPADTLLSFFAYGGGNPVGVTVAAGDVNGDGLADVVTGSATFAGHVKAFSGQNNGQLLGSYFAYGAGYLGGIYVAAGDLDGDGRAEIITGATNAPHVKALDAITGAERQSFIAYPGATFGVRVAAVDRDGDGLADILTGAGGSAPHVKLFDGQTLDLLDSFLAVPPNQSPSPGIFVGGSSK